MTSATTVNDADNFLLIQSGSSKKVAFSVFKYDSDDAASQIGDTAAVLRAEIASPISFGTSGQLPYTNVGGDDFLYSSGLIWDNRTLLINFGTSNVLIGDNSGRLLSGISNSFLGYRSGYSSTSADYNVFIGSSAGYYNTTGDYNSFTGSQSGESNTTGSYNTFNGYQSGYVNSAGLYNTFSGYQSGYTNTASGNTFSGYKSGYSNSTGQQNLFLGYQSGLSNTTGDRNAFIGHESGYSNTTGKYNVFSGYRSGYANIIGENNVIIGDRSGRSTNSDNNTLIGFESGYSNTTGTDNSFYGYKSGHSTTTGSNNVYLGPQTGYLNLSGTGNVFIGDSAGYNETGSNKLYIANNSTDTLIYGDFDGKSVTVNGDMTVTGSLTADFSAAAAGVENSIQVNRSGVLGYDSNFEWDGNSLNMVADSGTYNVFIGQNSGLLSLSGASNNTFTGYRSGESLTDGDDNTFIGYQSGRGNTTGRYNTYIGYNAAYLSNAEYNTICGNNAGAGLSTGSYNLFVGQGAGGATSTGGLNVFIGQGAGYSNNGSSNIFIGYNGGYNETGSNKLYIENSNSTSPLIYGEFDNDLIQINGDFKAQNDTFEVTVDTTFIRNKLKVTDGAIYVNGHIITPARASAYIASGDIAATTISVADTYYFLKGDFTNVDTCDFQFLADTLQYIGEETLTLTLNYSCTFSVGQVTTTVTTGISVNDVILEQSENDRRIPSTTDKGAWSGLATVTLSTNDKVKIEVKADKTGTVTAERFSAIIE